MSIVALTLLLIAAAMHAGWNLLLKRAREKQVFIWLAHVIGTLCYMPLLLWSPSVPASAWIFVVCTALAQVGYMLALAHAYEIGDFSLVYPLARGSAPALLTVWATLFLGEQPRPGGLAGLALLISGLIVVGSTRWWERRRTATISSSGLRAALLVACCISIYSAIDGTAMRFVDPLPYLTVSMAVTSIFVAPVILLRYGSASVVTEWRGQWRRIALVGILTMTAYLLVLQAYAVSRVSYVGAIREISIVMAALIGWRWLDESFGMTRVIGASLIFSGILVITVFG